MRRFKKLFTLTEVAKQRAFIYQDSGTQTLLCHFHQGKQYSQECLDQVSS